MIRSPIKQLLVFAICLVVFLIASVLDAQQPSTAFITCKDRDGELSHGSGVLIAHGKAGWSIAATCAHVVRDVRDGGISTTFRHAPGRPTLPSKLIAYNPNVDVAIVAFKTPDIDANPINDRVQVGMGVVREGYPKAGQLKVSRGKVTNLSKHYGDPSNPIITHTPISIQGESGGPIRDENGNLLGIVATSNFRTDSNGPTASTILNTLPQEWVQFCIPCQPQGTVIGRRSVIDGNIPQAPRISSVPRQEPKTPSMVPADEVAPEEPAETLDYAALADAIIKGMAGDERFRGDQGPVGPRGEPGADGKAGPPGRPGSDGRDFDPAKVVGIEQRLSRLENATFDVHVVSPNGDVLTGKVHAHGGLLKLDFSTFEGGH